MERYFGGFNATDLRARNCGRDGAACLAQYLALQRAPRAADEGRALQAWLAQAARLLAPYPVLARVLARADVRVVPDAVENGYPHTHGACIVLPERFFAQGHAAADHAVETLIHEAIHVYQRLHPIETNVLLVHRWNLDLCGLLSSRRREDALRSNPDTNDLCYASKEGCVMAAAYTAPDAARLSDVRFLGCGASVQRLPEYAQKDHPYELMASILARLIVRPSPPVDMEFNGNAWEAAALAWMRQAWADAA